MNFVQIGVLLIILGMLFMALGILFTLGGNGEGQSDVRAGAVILIGPVPIVLASDRSSAVIALLGAIALLLAVILWLRI